MYNTQKHIESTPISAGRKMMRLLFFAAVFGAACNKEISNDTPPAVPVLALQFDNNTLSLQQVDSAAVMFTRPGAATIVKKLQVNGNQMTANATGIPDGSWQASWKIYTRKPQQDYGRQYERTVGVTFPASSGLTMRAPQGDWSQHWWTRVLIAHDNPAFTFIAAMDFADPYFRITLPPGFNTEYFYVDRVALLVQGNTNQRIGGDAYERPGNLPQRHYANNTGFAAMVQQMQGRAWNKGEILLQMTDDTGREHTLFYGYRKP